MQPVKPLIHEEVGTPLIELDINVVLSNIITLICSTNQRPTFLRTAAPGLMRQWFNQARRNIDSNDMDKTLHSWWVGAQAGQAGAATAQDWKDPTRLFLAPFAELINLIIAEPAYVEDAGTELKRFLLSSGNWSILHVANPALGWPRDYMQFGLDLTAGMPLFGTNLGAIGKNALKPGETQEADSAFEQAQAAFAELLWAFDRIALTDKLIPKPSTLMGDRDPKEGFMGAARAAQAQSRHLAAIPALYYMQLPALWSHLTESLSQFGMEKAKILYPRDTSALQLREQLVHHFQSQVPLHPMTAMLANVFKARPIVSTYYGEYPALLVPSGVELPMSVLTADARAAGLRSGIADLVTASALAESLRLQSVAKTVVGDTWVKSVLKDVAPNLDEEYVLSQSAILRGASYATAIEQLARIRRYVERWPDISRTLGWSGSGGTVVFGKIETAGADFGLTDGDHVSDSPMTFLCGLRVLLPISNAQTEGFSRRFMSDFNTGPNLHDLADGVAAVDGVERVAIQWSVLPVRGHVATNAGDSSLAKYYILESMTMGETGYSPRFTEGVINDPVGKRVKNYFAMKTKAGFLPAAYPDLPVKRAALQTAALTYYPTDWGATAVSTTEPDLAQNQLLEGYGADAKQGTTRLLFRPDGWKTRVPIQMARRNSYVWLDELGNPSRTERFDGNVAFDNTLNISVDTSSLDAVIDMLRTEVPAIIDGLADESKPPEPAA